MEDKRYEGLGPSAAFLQRTSGLEIAGTAADCAVLSVATILPVLLSIRRLGIYADDWGNFGRFEGNGDRTIADCFRRLYSLPGTRFRPVMDLYYAVLFRMFGVHQLGYHVMNVLVFIATALLFYFSLRLLMRERFVALTIPLVFVLLPNYSSARFVPCAFMIGLSMAFFFLNLYAMLKAAQTAVLATGWTCLSVVALFLSGLAYEVAVPLFGLSLVVVWNFDRRKPVNERLRARSLALLLFSNAVALIPVLVFKRLTTIRYHGVVSVRAVVNGALQLHFYKLGLHLPIAVAKAIFIYWNPMLCVLVAVFGLVVFWYLRRLQRSSDTYPWRLKEAFCLMAFGLLVFTFGHMMFLVGETGFSATGFANRTAIAASLGIAIVISGAAMWVGALVKVSRAFIPPLLIAILCSSEFLVTSTIGSFWAAAAERQKLVLDSLQHDIPELPSHSTLLVDGVCPYIGPGIVFEGHQDMGGALQMLFHDPTLSGDVVTPQLQVGLLGIETRIYKAYRYYPYGLGLRVYDFRRRRMWNLQDVAAASEYFGMMGPAHTFCPEGSEGDEVPIF